MLLLKTVFKVLFFIGIVLFSLIIGFRVYLAMPALENENTSPYQNATIKNYTCVPIFYTPANYYKIYANDALIDVIVNYQDKYKVIIN